MNGRIKTAIMVLSITAILLTSSIMYLFLRQPQISVVDEKKTIKFKSNIWNISSGDPKIITSTSVSIINQTNACSSTFQLKLVGAIYPVGSSDSGGYTVLSMNISFNGSILDNLHPSSVVLHIMSSGKDMNISNSRVQLYGYTQTSVNTTTISPISSSQSFNGNNSKLFTLKLTNSPYFLQFKHSKTNFYNFSYSGLFEIIYTWSKSSSRSFNVTATLKGLSSSVSATVNTEVTNVF